MPSFARELEQTLHRVLDEAKRRRHQYATLEHLLLGLTEDPAASRVMLGCGVEIAELQDSVRTYLDTELDALRLPLPSELAEAPPPTEGEPVAADEASPPAEGEESEPKGKSRAEEIEEFERNGPSPTSGFQRVVQRAILHVQSAGREDVDGANVLVALFSERESYAVYFLQQQDMSRLDAVSFVTHGIGKSGPAPGTSAAADKAPPLPTVLTRPLYDDSIPHLDTVAANPKLLTPKIADKIVEFIEQIMAIAADGAAGAARTSLTIGIYGAWGSGKSTLLSSIATRIAQDGAVVVNINPWQWNGEGDIFAFMNAQLLASLRARKGYRWQSLAISAMLLARRHSAYVVGTLFVAVLVSILVLRVHWSNIHFGQLPKDSALAVLIAALSAILAKPIGSLIEALFLRTRPEEPQSDILSSSYRYLMLTKRVGRSRNKPVFFVFDDLDRCDPDKTALFMQTIHRLTIDGSINLVACDDRIVTAAIYGKFKEVADLSGEGADFGQRFMEKIVQVYFRMPDLTERDLKTLGVTGRAFVAPRGSPAEADDAEEDDDDARYGWDADEAAVGGYAPIKDIGTDDADLDQASLARIISDVIGCGIELFRVPLRRIKFLSNLIKLYIMVYAPNDEPAAYRMSAFLLLTSVNHDWLVRHGLDGEPWNGPRRKQDYASRLIAYLGSDKAEIAALYALCGIADRQLWPGPKPAAAAP